jgi:hypothetical protein
MPPRKDPCSALADKMQGCMLSQDFKADKCKSAIDEMRTCCLRYRNTSDVCYNEYMNILKAGEEEVEKMRDKLEEWTKK